MKILLLILVCFLGNRDFETREVAHACITSVGEYFNIEDELVDFYKESKDIEVKTRLRDIYDNLPVNDYPDIGDAVNIISSTTFMAINDKASLEEKYMVLAKGDKYKAGELYIKDVYKRYQEDVELVKKQYPLTSPISYPALYLTKQLEEHKNVIKQQRTERIK